MALEKHYGFPLRNAAIDTMEAFLVLSGMGGWNGKEPKGYSLDALCDLFNVTPHDRHTALGDAYLTAQVFLRILKEAGKLGQWNLADLHAWHANEPYPFGKGE